ncbi:hypothetical protein TNCV_2434711 [Trichonephila clavipes]|nr:hypothetical protein TNCV_2434711 [Trichonephila clavipes]
MDQYYGSPCFVDNDTPCHHTRCGVSSFLMPFTTPNGGVKGSTRNGHRDPKCPSASCLRIVREYTGAPSKGATGAWMAADEAVGFTSISYDVAVFSMTD